MAQHVNIYLSYSKCLILPRISRVTIHSGQKNEYYNIVGKYKGRELRIMILQL